MHRSIPSSRGSHPCAHPSVQGMRLDMALETPFCIAVWRCARGACWTPLSDTLSLRRITTMSRLHWTRPLISSSLLGVVAPTVADEALPDARSHTPESNLLAIGPEHKPQSVPCVPCVPQVLPLPPPPLPPAQNGREVEVDDDDDRSDANVPMDPNAAVDPSHRHTVELDDSNETAHPQGNTGALDGTDQIMNVSLLPALSVVQLKDLCRRNRLKCSGKKADLIARLRDAAAAVTATAPSTVVDAPPDEHAIDNSVEDDESKD
jgi:hypothetical protein